MAHKTAASSCTPDGGAPVDAGETSYGPPLFNGKGDDPACKYNLELEALSWQRDADVEMSVAVGDLSTIGFSDWPDGDWVVGADAIARISHDGINFSPTPGLPSTEVSPGIYRFAPVRFTAPGRWTVRVDLFPSCTDALADSPATHAAFYVDMP
jgi:hypothetical protein